MPPYRSASGSSDPVRPARPQKPARTAELQRHARQAVRDLARAQCTPEEIAAYLADEYGGDVTVISEFLYEEPLRTKLAASRMAGQAEMRLRQYEVASTGTSGAATQMGMWWSRQYLGHTTSGVDEQTRKQIERLDKMSPAEQLAHLQRLVRQLGAAKDEEAASP